GDEINTLACMYPGHFPMALGPAGGSNGECRRFFQCHLADIPDDCTTDECILNNILVTTEEVCVDDPCGLVCTRGGWATVGCGPGFPCEFDTQPEWGCPPAQGSGAEIGEVQTGTCQ